MCVYEGKVCVKGNGMCVYEGKLVCMKGKLFTQIFFYSCIDENLHCKWSKSSREIQHKVKWGWCQNDEANWLYSHLIFNFEFWRCCDVTKRLAYPHLIAHPYDVIVQFVRWN